MGRLRSDELFLMDTTLRFSPGAGCVGEPARDGSCVSEATGLQRFVRLFVPAKACS